MKNVKTVIRIEDLYNLLHQEQLSDRIYDSLKHSFEEYIMKDGISDVLEGTTIHAKIVLAEILNDIAHKYDMNENTDYQFINLVLSLEDVLQDNLRTD